MNKIEKEKLKLVQDKCQSLLADLLRDEDNKYCVDCDAKGPRWASWNLGIFLCIRCAGIHRNLGVHISKVKSVNLDAWTASQVAYLQQMGNSKARAVYEANLPDNFRRPQVDSALEAFIRAKYEQKKYIAKEWVQPPTPPPAFDVEEERKKEKEKKKNKIIKNQTNTPIVEVQTNSVPRPHSSPAGTVINADKMVDGKKASNDLLGLDTPQKRHDEITPTNDGDDPFDAFVSAPLLSTSNDSSAKKCDKSAAKADEEADFFNQKAPEDKKLDKESILKLYENTNLSANMFNMNSLNQQMTFANSTPNPVMCPPFGNQLQSHTQGVPVIPQGAYYNGQTQQQQSQPQQPLFPATTNPFLANNVTSPMVPPQVTQLQQQMSSLQFKTDLHGISNNWPQTSVGTSIVNPTVPPTSTGLINPFVQPPQQQPANSIQSGFQSSNDAFANLFGPPADNNAQWIMNANPAIAATSNLWQ